MEASRREEKQADSLRNIAVIILWMSLKRFWRKLLEVEENIPGVGIRKGKLSKEMALYSIPLYNFFRLEG